MSPAHQEYAECVSAVGCWADTWRSTASQEPAPRCAWRRPSPKERPETAEPIQVLLVEDQAAIRQAIAAEFEPEPDFAIVGQAALLAEARETLASPDVVILDLGPSGSERPPTGAGLR
jgi:hypothetical protein